MHRQFRTLFYLGSVWWNKENGLLTFDTQKINKLNFLVMWIDKMLFDIQKLWQIISTSGKCSTFSCNSRHSTAKMFHICQGLLLVINCLFSYEPYRYYSIIAIVDGANRIEQLRASVDFLVELCDTICPGGVCYFINLISEFLSRALMKIN